MSSISLERGKAMTKSLKTVLSPGRNIQWHPHTKSLTGIERKK